MFMIVVIGVLLIVAFVMALFSLRSQGHKKEVASVAKKLAKGKVIFHSDASSSE